MRRSRIARTRENPDAQHRKFDVPILGYQWEQCNPTMPMGDQKEQWRGAEQGHAAAVALQNERGVIPLWQFIDNFF